MWTARGIVRRKDGCGMYVYLLLIAYVGAIEAGCLVGLADLS